MSADSSPEVAASELSTLLGPAVRGDHCRQVDADALIVERSRGICCPARGLDFGLGDSSSIERLALMLPDVRWRGVDATATISTVPPRWRDGRITRYDGYELPFPDRRFNLVRAVGSIERVPRPGLAMRELARVLVDGGLLIGEVSQFAPSHLGVRRNLTPLGLLQLAREAGLELEEARPGVDGLAQLRAIYVGRSVSTSSDAAIASSLIEEIDARDRAEGKSLHDINLAKLIFSGRWVFVLRRGAVSSGTPGRALADVRVAPPFSSSFPGSLAYWRLRYAAGGDSGAGSYGSFAEFKAEVLNALFDELAIDSVIEFGCGDGNQLKLLRIRDYWGLDVSPLAIEQCRSAFEAAPGRRFATLDAYAGEQSDCSMSLDVIYHLVEDSVFEHYMQRLFAAARYCVVIYSSNCDALDSGAPHVRHRRFTDWVAREEADWELLRHVPNRYPFAGDPLRGSFADFFVYIRRTGDSNA